MGRVERLRKSLIVSDLIDCCETWLINRFRTVLVRVNFAPRFRRFTYMRLRTSDTLRDNLASACMEIGSEFTEGPFAKRVKMV